MKILDTLSDGAAKLHDTKGGKLAMLVAVVSLIVTTVGGIIGNHIAARDALQAQHDLIDQMQQQQRESLKRWQGQKAVNNYQLGSNLTSKIEAQAVKDK